MNETREQVCSISALKIKTTFSSAYIFKNNSFSPRTTINQPTNQQQYGKKQSQFGEIIVAVTHDFHLFFFPFVCLFILLSQISLACL